MAMTTSGDSSREREIDDIKYKTQYEYNNAGQMTLMIYPSNKRVKVEHDARGRLSALQRVDDSGAMQESYLSGINYRADGLISSQNLGDETTESFGYSNDRLQLTSQEVKKGGSTLLSLNYGYGAAAGQMGSGSTAGNSGQLVSVNGTINGQSRNQTFRYDNVGRLVTATGWGAWERRFEYDQYGNRTKVWNALSGGNQLQDTVVEQQAGGMKTNRIANVNGTLFRYDVSGNVIEEGVARVYGHDAENRLVSASVNGLGSESYGYGAGNRRIKKQTGAVVTHYIWEGDQVIAEYEYGGGVSPTGKRYYHQDRLSTRIITDGAGAVVGTTDHLPFGEEIGVSGVEEKHKFTTYERDQTGVDYAVNRYYAPQQGRFNQVDPLGMGAVSLANPQSLNLYSYAENDPINRVDPTGTQWQALASFGAHVSSFFLGSTNTIAFVNSDPLSFGGGYAMLLHGGEENSGGGGGGGGAAAANPIQQEPGSRGPNVLPGSANNLTAEDCAKIRTLLEREAASGTTGASTQSILGEGDGLLSTIKNGNLMTKLGKLDLEWYGQLTSITGRAIQSVVGGGAGPMGQLPSNSYSVAVTYIGAKHFWTAARLVGNAVAKLMGEEVTLTVAHPIAFTDEGERTAFKLAIDPTMSWGKIFNEEFMNANCPSPAQDKK